MKKFISALLITVLLITAVPFSNVARTTLGTTEASAKESVNGSFQYLKNYICANGNTDSTKENIYVNYLVAAKLIYNKKYDYICYQLGMSSTSKLFFYLEYNSDVCFVVAYGKSNNINWSLETTLDKYYTPGDSLNFEVVENGIHKRMTADTQETWDGAISSNIGAFNTMLETLVNMSLGNFGFINVAEPKDLKTVKSLFYKRTTTFDCKAETLTAGISIKSIDYESSNTSILTVDENGTVKAVGKGSAEVTRTITDINGTVYQDVLEVSVSFNIFQWFIYIFLLGFLWY